MVKTTKETHNLVTSYVNDTEHYIIGEETIEIEKTDIRSMSDLYRFGIKHYGKCIGKCYVDEGKPLGYVFRQRVKYEDCDKTYIREVWLMVNHYRETIIIETLQPFEGLS